MSARWARPQDLQPLVVRRPRKGRLTLGLADGRLVAAEPRQSIIVVGPVQTGKTSGFAVPAILEWQGPVLATSVKTDLLRDTIEARQRCGRVQLFDPAGSTGLESDGWTPLVDCYTWSGARKTAAWLAEGASVSKKGLSDADFWYSTAARV